MFSGSAVLELLTLSNTLPVLAVSALSMGSVIAVFLIFAKGQLLELAFASVQYPLSGILLTAFTLIFLILGYFGAGSSCTEYMLRRMGVSSREFILQQTQFNGIMLVIFWGMQALAMWVVCIRFSSSWPGYMNTPALYLACYRSPLLSSFLPAANFAILLRNLVFSAVLAFLASLNSYKLRSHEGLVCAPFLLALPVTAYSFSSYLHTGSYMDVYIYAGECLLMGLLLVWGLLLFKRLENRSMKGVRK